MGEVGAGGTSDIVKVMSVDPLSLVLNPWLVIPHYWFNKTKQHTHTLSASVCIVCGPVPHNLSLFTTSRRVRDMIFRVR